MSEQLSYLLSQLLSRATMGLAGAAMAMTLIWYLGPLVPGMNGVLPRAAAVLVVALIWSGVVGAKAWRRRRRERALAAGVAGSEKSNPDGGPAKNGAADAADEVAQLRARMTTALARLRGKRGRRGYLYEQPWFLLIGPPGAGKTTALTNAGLKFPLTEDGADDAPVRGVGGTRLCDWWFADDAVLIDTAGRYTTQDSDAAIDRGGWHGFLDLLRHTRPRQPINGVIVVVSLTDIVAAPVEERAAHARAIRRRVKEVSDRLHVEVPVYMVFSKADQLRGFSEYFDDLDADARKQVWGMTFPLGRGVEAFAPEFKLLLDRLNSRQLERLQAERGQDRRATAAGFPLQAASVAAPLEEFLRQAFGGTRLDPAPFLRGVYLSSATQQGTPLDQLTGLLAHSFGIDQRQAPSLRPVAGRSYFLQALLRDVVLGEALLASRRSKGERRRRWLRAGGFAATGTLTLAGLLVLAWSERSGNAAVLRTEAALGAYRGQLSSLALDPVASDDLPIVTPVLDTAAALPAPADGFIAIPGLSQAGKLRQGASQAYREALRDVLLPRLVWRLEAQMRARLADAEFLYEATRVYLMLGGEGPLDPALVRDWEMRDWAARFPGALNTELRDHLSSHLAALLGEPLPPVTLDGALVAAARATFKGVSLAARVYGRIRGDAGTLVPDWSPAQALGPAGIPLFRRVSGAALTDGIPGFYTGDGFRRVLLDHLAQTARRVVDERWVLGQADASSPWEAAPDALERAVVELWVQDAESHWDALLADIALASLGDRTETVKRLYVLSSSQSPMRDLLAAIVREQALGLPPPDPKAQAPAAPDLIAGEADAAMGQHYAALRALMTEKSAEPPFAGLLRLLSALRAELSRTGDANADVPQALQSSGDPVSLLQAEAERQPMPVSVWLRQIAATGRTMLGSNAAAAAATTFATSDGPGPLCRQVVDGRYPFDGAARADAPLTGFAKLFGPNGALDTYFQSQLKPYVDTAGPAWRVHPVGGVAAPVDASAVASFQRAASIREAFFSGGGVAQIRFLVGAVPPGSDPKAVLTIGATRVAMADAAPVALTWPVNGGVEQAIVTFDPAGLATPVAEAGSWAIFRLVARGQAVPSGPGGVRVAFRSGDEVASFSLRTDQARNPFDRRLLEGFHCPVVR